MVALLEEIVQSVELWLRLIKKPQPYVDPTLDPVLLVPGIAGSLLNAVDESGKEERVWVRIFGADREFRTKLWSRFDPSTGKSVSLDPKTRISVPDDRFGLYAIDVLDPDMASLASFPPILIESPSSSPAIISTTAPLFVTLDCFKGEEKASGLHFAVGSNLPCIDLRPGTFQYLRPKVTLSHLLTSPQPRSGTIRKPFQAKAIGRDSVYYFHDMIFEMIRWGYKEGKTLFGFGYDFRQSNRFEETLDCLAAKLESAYTASGGKKIIVISHSMGGLLVKCFMSLRSNIFEKYVKNWIAIAAPFQDKLKVMTITLSSEKVKAVRKQMSQGHGWVV
ncbi:hypothetical protein RJ639_023890 [Escallonia herrerae]|uniref:Uncharacterized protein n=1 Tax=Escallonia herrerae TaxID=1293975 RepID=A0AA88V3E1_9ASTE|nr:hypothetical protein RJ639_023890 [Escallonia herrerae]